MTPDSPSILKRVGSNAWLLLAFVALCWGGNVVAARIAVGQISPMVLVCLRWAVVSLVIAAFGGRKVSAALPDLRQHWLYILVMGTTGFTLSNSMLYLGARYTGAINLAIIQGTMPLFVLVGASLVLRIQIGTVRALCALVAFAGILVVAGKGDVEAFSHLQVNRGDLIALGGAALYGVFTLGLRYRPPMSSFAFFIGISFAAFLTSLVAMGIEFAAGQGQWPTFTGVLVLLYVAIFTSLLGQILFIRAVELIGPSRAILFQNAVPVVAALMAIVVLNEKLHLYHAVALALVIGGLVTAERFGRR